MQVNNLLNSQIMLSRRNNTSFGDGRINILATSDNHGKLEPMPAFYSNIVSNLDEIFPDRNSKSTLNIGAIAGDWFMDPTKNAFVTDLTKTAGDYQLLFLNKLVELVKKCVPNFQAFYTPGNHCFDGGDKYLVERLKQADLTTILSNADLDNSSLIKGLSPKEREKIKKYTILEVPDDKVKNKVHKALILGVTIPGVDFYTPRMVNDIDILDRSDRNIIDTNEEDLKQTYKALNSVVEKFKAKNPKGAVVVMSHTGNKLSRMIANNVPNIDLILNGHDHKDKEVMVKNPNGKETFIVSLGRDSKKFNSVQLHFNDKGLLDNLSSKSYYTANAPKLETNPFDELLEESFSEDKKPLLYISGPEDITMLSQEGVRFQNSLLANFVTDSILTSIKKYRPDTQIFGIASSAFRQDLPVNDWTNNLKIRDVMKGSVDPLSQVHIGETKGSDLAAIIIDNVSDNIKDNETNTIFQWSGLRIDKLGFIDAFRSGKNEIKDFQPFIHVKNKEGKYEAIELNKNYVVALPNKFFMKSNIQKAKKLEDSFKPINKTLDKLFREYLEDNNYRVTLPDPNDIRIII